MQKMIKKIFRILVIFLLCASAIFIMNISVKALPFKYLILLFVGALIFVGGEVIFHKIVKKKFQGNVPLIKTLDFVFGIIWFSLLIYLLFHIPFSKDFPAK